MIKHNIAFCLLSLILSGCQGGLSAKGSANKSTPPPPVSFVDLVMNPDASILKPEETVDILVQKIQKGGLAAVEESELEWTISKPDIVEVTFAEGKLRVLALALGSVEVTAGIKGFSDQPEKSASAIIDVATPAEDPVFSLAPGTYKGPQTVELSTTLEGADILYTVDGSEVDHTSTKYTTPIEITEDTTINVLITKPAVDYSETRSGEYIITE